MGGRDERSKRWRGEEGKKWEVGDDVGDEEVGCWGRDEDGKGRGKGDDRRVVGEVGWC